MLVSPNLGDPNDPMSANGFASKRTLYELLCKDLKKCLSNIRLGREKYKCAYGEKNPLFTKDLKDEALRMKKKDEEKRKEKKKKRKDQLLKEKKKKRKEKKKKRKEKK
jgi:hypothetical protein